MSQFAEDIEFIPLETTDECLLGNSLSNIVVTKDYIFVFDFTKSYRFSRQGEFLNSIGSIGNGPGELVKAMQMCVDTLNQWVYLADTRSNKLVKYNYEGDYIDHFNYKSMGGNNTFYKPYELLLENYSYQFSDAKKRYSLFSIQTRQRN